MLWQVAGERILGELAFFFFSFLDLGLSYTVVWVVQDSVSFTQWFVYSFSSEVGNSFTLTF